MADSKPPIRIVRVSHMRYQHADIEKTDEFLTDFGMKLIAEEGDTRWYTGEGPDAYVYVAKKVSNYPTIEARIDVIAGQDKRVPRRCIPR